MTTLKNPNYINLLSEVVNFRGSAIKLANVEK